MRTPIIGLAAAALALVHLAPFAQAPEARFIAPNEHLTAQGIPPIPASLAARLAGYNDFRPRVLLDWHPIRRELLLSTRGKGVGNQLHIVRGPMGELEQLTDFPDPVQDASFEPKTGAYIVYARDEGGSEASQLYRLDLDTRKSTLLTDPREKHGLGEWSHSGERLLVDSTQLDKTGKRTEVTTDLWIIDPLKPGSGSRKLAALPGGGWGDIKWSLDDRQLVAINFKSINDSSVWLIDAASGARRQILPDPADTGAPAQAWASPNFTADGKALILTTDREGEFHQLTHVDLASLKQTPWSRHIPWDVQTAELSKSGALVAGVVNNDGMAGLHLFDAAGKELARPALPVGGVTGLKWGRGGEVAFSLDSARSPNELYTFNPSTGKTEQWTRSTAPVDSSSFRDSSVVRWKSFDGRSISGLMTRPGAQFQGRRPVLISIHGGPEGQSKAGFLGRWNYLVNELGVVMIQPNVRGSSGYGKSFLKLDNGYQREDSVKDIGALLDWIATQPDLDPRRVMVMGGSYGGYMSLAVATNYASRIVGAIDIVGISDFTTFLENTESYRRDLRRVEYGDERDPMMRAHLQRIAPMTNAHRISKPLFVVQGKNDPRVPLSESEQMVAKVRKNGVPVWYLMADNEGHGFRRKPNVDFYGFAVVRFVEEYLLK